MHDRILHRQLQAATFPGGFLFVERAEDADCHQHAGAGIADRAAGFGRRVAGVARHAHRAARGLRDHVEGERFFVRAALAEALDLAIDDTGVDLLQHIVAEPQALDRAGREVLGEHIGFLDQLLDEFDAACGLEIDRRRLLVGIEDLEIEGIGVSRIGRRDAPSRIAALRVLDLDDFGPEPGQRLRAGGPRLELGQIDDPNAFQAAKRRVIFSHSLRLLQGGNSPGILL